MTTQTTVPMQPDWTFPSSLPNSVESTTHATASEVNGQLARIEVADIESAMVPYLAAATAELALLAGIPWRFSTDDAPVALLRAIARVAIIRPDVGGPHTTRLHDQLT